ncbi:hypothetical protein [Kitasatospora sp. NPDC051914]|uniref:hypothetical protein n=1 Tax=Kitasatospora sp. NPDC051914 TaxID=3154945 RepID=UPI0034422CD5
MPMPWARTGRGAQRPPGWAALDDLAAGLDRRPEPPATTGQIPPELLERLWALPGLPLREHTLWRLLHESAAPVQAVLSLSVEDLDLADRRARTGDTWVGWRSGTARLLPDLLAGRTRGPLFLDERRPGPARTPGPADLCPDTGRRRLSYERAEHLFKQLTRPLDPTGQGWTLRMLKT